MALKDILCTYYYAKATHMTEYCGQLKQKQQWVHQGSSVLVGPREGLPAMFFGKINVFCLSVCLLLVCLLSVCLSVYIFMLFRAYYAVGALPTNDALELGLLYADLHVCPPPYKIPATMRR